MPKPILIPDGYTKRVGFNECEDHEEFEFEYRPIRGLDKSSLTRFAYIIDNKEKREDAWFDFLADHVLSWSVSDNFTDDIKRVECLIINLITNVISGDMLPDFEYDADGTKVQIEKAVTATDEGDAGNSTAG